MNLAAYLVNDGYRQIRLTRSGVGHFHANGTLGDRRVSVLVDTGAANTIVSLSSAEAFGMTLAKLPFQGGGAGAARMDVFQVSNAALRFGELALRVPSLLAMDLSHVNEALRLKGQAPVDVILGVDVFDAQSAVIDYGSRSLFLKP